MKKTAVLIAVFAILCPNFNAFAEGEDDEDRRRRKGGGFGAHLNLAPAALGTYSANFEYGISKDKAAILTLGYIYLDLSISTTDGAGNTIENGYAYSGFMAAPEFRFYFDPSRRTGLDGFFGGAYLKYQSLSTPDDALSEFNLITDPNDPMSPPVIEEVNYGVNYSGLSVGVTFGYTYAFKSGLTLGGFLGFGYFLMNNISYTVKDVTSEVNDFLYIDPRLGVTVGYRF